MYLKDCYARNVIRRSIFAWVVLPGLIANCISAGEWQAESGFSIDEVYSDNVQLDNTDEDGEFITVLTPSLSVSGKGKRAQLNLAASFQFNDYDNEGQSENFMPKLNAKGNIELVEGYFFIDANASAGQSTINPFAVSGVRGGSSSVVGGVNQTNTYNASISPYFVSRLKDIASLNIRFKHDELYHSGGDLDDSVRESASLRLASGEAFSLLNWGLHGSYNRTEFDQERGEPDFNNEFVSANLQLGYRLSRKWQLTGSVGHEWNDFIAINPNIDDDIWTVGLIWTPNQRISLETGYGNRFFGNTPNLDFSYRHKRATLTASYSEQLTDTRSLRGEQQILFVQDGFALVFDPQSGQLLIIPENQTTQGNSALINRQADISYRFQANRTIIGFTARQSKQNRLEFNSESIFSTYGINFTREITPKLDLDSSLSWSEQEDPAKAASDVTVVYVGFSRKLANSAKLTAGYSHAERDTDRLNDRNYRENRVSLSLRLNF